MTESRGLDTAERHRQQTEHARTVACMRAHREHWRVIAYKGNCSAFNGYRWTRSAYSAIRCGQCGRIWRTKAAYVETLPDMSAAEREEWLRG